MTTIINGRFQRTDQAEEAMKALIRAGFASEQVTSFFVNPAGQHDLSPIGGDEDESPGTHEAGSGATVGAAVAGAVGLAVGIATVPVLGPAAAIAGVGVGAYTGSLVGAMARMGVATGPGNEASGMQSELDEAVVRKSGMLVAVCAPELAHQEAAIRILCALDAVDVEKAEGTFSEGQWVDFDPLTHMIPVAK